MKRILSIIALLVILLAFALYGTREVQPQTDQNTIKFSRQGYEALFAHGVLHEIEIVISAEEWNGLLQDMKAYASTDQSKRPLTGNYRRATFIYKGPAGDAVIEEVGFRTKGHFNRPLPQDYLGRLHRAHFKVKFDEVFDLEEGTREWEDRNQRRFSRLRELEFRLNSHAAGQWDTSQIRELYAYDLLNRAGVYASRTGSARLTINIGGEKHYFGIYTLLEPVDKSFLTKRFGSDKNDGNLYKCLWADSGPASLEPVDSVADSPLIRDKRAIGVKDWTKHYRPTYDLTTNTAVQDHTVLLDFIHNLNGLSGDDFKKYLEANFEVDRFLRYLAMNVLIGKWDDYWADGNNYYLYFNNGGKIEFIPCDYDMAFGGGFQLFDTANCGIYDWGNHNKELLAVLAPQIPKDVLEKYGNFHYPLVEKLFEIDEYRAMYEHYLKEFITPANKLFIYSEYEEKFNMLYKLYSPYLDNDMDESEEMVSDEATRRYFRDKTLSIIKQLGLDEKEYEIPALEPLAAGEPTEAEKPTPIEYPEGLSFEAREVRNTQYGYSFKHPKIWNDVTVAQLYEAKAPTKVTGLFVSAWDIAWGDTLPKVLAVVFKEAPVEIIASGKTTLSDGTAAAVAEYKAKIANWPMHCYSIATIRGGKWIVLTLWNIDQYAPFDRALFAEIAYTLRFH